MHQLARAHGVTNRRLKGRMGMRPLALMFGLVILAVLAPGALAASPRVTVALAKSAYGPVLFDGRGYVLYAFTGDRPGRSTCGGACAKAWPPYILRGAAARRRRREGLAHLHNASSRRVETGHIRRPASLLLRRRP